MCLGVCVCVGQDWKKISKIGESGCPETGSGVAGDCQETVDSCCRDQMSGRVSAFIVIC